MGYLQPGEYGAFGLPTDLADAWVSTASAMMEAHCRRPSLIATTYTERLRVGSRSGSVRLSYGPLVSVTAVRARYARGSCDASGDWLGDVATVFALPGQWVTVDPTTLDVVPATQTVTLVAGLFALPYAEAEVTYIAGLAAVPDAVKVACAQIVRNAQATPGLNVRSSRMDTLQTEYFSDALLDVQVRAMLRPYVAERLN